MPVFQITGISGKLTTLVICTYFNFPFQGNMKQHFLTHKNREGIKCSPSHSNSNPNSDCEQPKTPNALHRQSAGHDSEGSNDNSRPEAISLKRSPPEGDGDPLPIAKRQQGK